MTSQASTPQTSPYATAQKPTASELEILRVLWERGPSTVRQVYKALNEKKDTGYTT
ncbi:MAG: BlaI/MecI/CopY family transcriptional regulator, partial [Candidatus Acidiferrales bacterium]